MTKRALVDLALMSSALLMGGEFPIYNGGSEPKDNPGPITHYPRHAIRAAAAAERKAKHEAKMARRAARRK